MNINGVLLFLLSFVTITVFVKKEETISQAASLSDGTVDIIEKKCSGLMKIIHANNVTDYLSNCQFSVGNSGRISEKLVLQYACFIGENIISYMCEKAIPIPKEYLNLEVDNKITICPFNFSQIKQLDNLPNANLKDVLMKTEQCKQVCFDLSEPKNQCVVLSKLVEFFSSVNTQEPPAGEVVKEISQPEISQPEISQPEPKVPSTAIERTEKTKKLSTKESHEELLEQKKRKFTRKPEVTVNKPEVSNTEVSKEPGPKIDEDNKPMEKPMEEEEKTLKPVDTSTSKSSLPVIPAVPDPSNNDISFNNENEPMMTKNDKSFNEDLESDNYPESDKFEPEINQVPDMQRTENSDMEGKYAVNKKSTMDESLNHKEIYSGEGFFQAEESHFFFYFLMFSSVIIIGYLAFHNKNKILAYALEGSSGRRNRRRPNPARYRKLETNLEEAISSNASQTAASSVVY